MVCWSASIRWRAGRQIWRFITAAAPGLVVEVLSPSENRKRKQEKLDDYARIGVPEVWVISAEAQSVEIQMLSEGKLAVERIIGEGDPKPTRLPAIKMPVSEIWFE